MNSGRVYTPPIFIARGIDPSIRDVGHTNNIGGVYTPTMFIATGTDPSTGGVGVRDEDWKGVHACNIHREGYRPLNRGHRSTR